MARILRWKEPPDFKRALARAHGLRPNPWFRPLFMLGIVAVALGAAAFHNKPAFGDWSLTVALAVGGGWLIAYGVPFIASRDPDLVAITERGIGRRVNLGGAVKLQSWSWEQIASCSLESMDLEGQTFTVLVLHGLEEELTYFAIHPKVDLPAVTAAIRANGRELHDHRSIRSNQAVDSSGNGG